jgi:hypothetical protein
MHHFDTASTTWTDLTNQMKGDLPGPRFGHGITSTRDSIYVYGGYDGEHSCTRLPLNHANLNEPLFASAGAFLPGLLRFNPSTLVWTNLNAAARGEPPSARILFGFAAVGDTLYVFGGDDGLITLFIHHICSACSGIDYHATSTPVA